MPVRSITTGNTLESPSLTYCNKGRAEVIKHKGAWTSNVHRNNIHEIDKYTVLLKDKPHNRSVNTHLLSNRKGTQSWNVQGKSTWGLKEMCASIFSKTDRHWQTRKWQRDWFAISVKNWKNLKYWKEEETEEILQQNRIQLMIITELLTNIKQSEDTWTKQGLFNWDLNWRDSNKEIETLIMSFVIVRLWTIKIKSTIICQTYN